MVQRANQITPHPRNPKQKEYIDSIRNYSQTFAIGPAGTGKTYLPTVLACEMYLRGEIDKIIVTRPAVEVGEQHGFLPGGIEKKLAPWVLPVTEVIEECLGSKQKFIDMYKAGDFEVAPFAYMRGRTFRNAFVILDEAQNVTRAQMEMFLTRLGDNSKVVICGDVRQTDLRETSGLSNTLNLARKFNIPAGIIEFQNQDVVRSSLCQMWVKAFSSPSP